MLDHGDTGTLTPDVELFDSGGAEGVGCAEHHLVSGGFELGGEFADGGGLAHSVDTHNHYHMGMVAFRNGEVLFGRLIVVFSEKFADFLTEELVKLRGVDIFVAGHTGLDAFDDFKGCVDPYVRGDEHLFEVVKHVIVDFRFSGDGSCDFREETLLGAVKPLVEGLLLFLGEKFIEKSHYSIIMCLF